MRHRTTVVLFVIFLAGLGVLWWADYADVPTREQQQRLLNRVLPELIDAQPLDVRKVEVDRRNGPAPDRLVVARDEDDAWQIKEPVDAQADPELVDTLVRNLKDLRKAGDAGTIQGDPAPYGLAEPEATVKVFGRDGKVPLATLALGKALKDRLYVRPGAGTGIEVVDPRPLEAATLPAARWRDTAMVRVPSFRVESVSVHDSEADRQTTLERSDRKWRLTRPVKVPADDDKSEGLVAEIAALRVADHDTGFVADNVTGPDLSKYGLDKPRMTIDVTPFGPGGRVQSVKLGLPVPDKKGQVYAVRGGQDDVVRLDVGRLREAIGGPNALRSQKVLDFKPTRVDRVRVDARGMTFDLARSARGWTLIGPARENADAAAVRNLLTGLVDLKSSEFLDPATVAEPRLDPPSYRVRGWESAGAKPTDPPAEPQGEPRFALDFGRQDALKKTVFGRVPGDPTVLALPETVLDVLPKNAFAFRDRAVLSIPPAQFTSVTVERGSTVVKVEAPPRTGAKGVSWRMVEPVSAAVDDGTLTNLLVQLGNLRAQSWEGDSAGALEAFGFDSPGLRVKWTVEGGDHGVLRLGKKKEGGAAVYANLEGDPRVFSLSRASVTPLEAELHTQKLLDFKPSDAARLEIRWPTRTIVFQKAGGPPGAGDPGWGVAPGYDPSGFDVSRVESIVATLSDLKTPRFLQYRGPIPAATGLNPARLALTVETSGKVPGRHTVRLGENVTEVSYSATTATGDTGPVVVLPSVGWADLMTPPRRPGDLPDDVFAPVPTAAKAPGT